MVGDGSENVKAVAGAWRDGENVADVVFEDVLGDAKRKNAKRTE